MALDEKHQAYVGLIEVKGTVGPWRRYVLY